jgi:hypothetical protein
VALRLVESALPDAVELGQSCFEKLSSDPEEMGAAIVELCDSPVASAREFGLELFNRNLRDNCSLEILTKLAETEDAKVRRCVLELLGNEANESLVLLQLQRRVLYSANEERETKELAKDQLASAANIDHDLLLHLARGSCQVDAEWAIEKMTQLAARGEFVKGLSVVSEGEI